MEEREEELYQMEKEIKQLIEKIIGGKYTGKLKVSKEEFLGECPLWSLFLYLDLEQTPLILAYQGTEENFKNFICEEIKRRKLEGVHFWKAVQEYPPEYE